MKLKCNFVTNEIAGSVVAVPVGTGSNVFNGYVKLNETGAFIFDMLKNDVSREEIIEGILNNFEGCTLPQVEKTVDEFIARLNSADMLC